MKVVGILSSWFFALVFCPTSSSGACFWFFSFLCLKFVVQMNNCNSISTNSYHVAPQEAFYELYFTEIVLYNKSLITENLLSKISNCWAITWIHVQTQEKHANLIPKVNFTLSDDDGKTHKKIREKLDKIQENCTFIAFWLRIILSSTLQK